MWTVAFPGDLYRRLESFLFSTVPYENGCFLLANHYRTKDKAVLLVTGVIKPTNDSWSSRSSHALVPSSSFISKCVMASLAEESSLIMVHTHPNPLHPATFSAIDKRSNGRLFANLSEIVPGRPLGSLVFSRSGVCGVVFDEGKHRRVDKIRIVGKTLVEFPGVGARRMPLLATGAKFDRQRRALGGLGQQRLQDTAVTIVGAGGTGSPVAVQLARMGVRSIQLIDMDRVDETNLPRLYGARNADVGRPKVEVLKRHLRSFSNSKIQAVCGDIAEEGMTGRLIESDVIFACTDNLTSRSILDEISSRFYIPLIDVGCRIHLNEDGSISQAIAKVQAVTPDTACLWCTGTLDGRLILQESLPDDEKRKLAEEGYYEEIGEQPSVISLTTMAASMAVNKLLSILGAFGERYSSRTQIELKGGFMIDDGPEIRKGCICRKYRGRCNLKR